MNANDDHTNHPMKTAPTLTKGKGRDGAANRQDRLKAALKANMARRKAQAKARAVDDQDAGGRQEKR